MARSRHRRAVRVHDLLGAKGASLATVESLTGGSLAAMLTAVPGASQTYVGGLVTYATSLKVDLAGVPQDLVDRHGVISPECAVAMARGALAVTGSTYALSTTGVAGPERQEGCPAGTVYVGVAGPTGTTTLALELVGDRAQIITRTCEEALSVLADILEQEESTLG